LKIKKPNALSIGWFDLFADFNEPGNEQNETLETGAATAAAGGYTDVCILPNTFPVTQYKSNVEFIKSKSGMVNLHPIGAVSKNIEGKDLAEMYDMKLAGAVAFSDGKIAIQHAGLLLKALQYVRTFNGVIIELPEDTSISKHGLMNEGIVSTQLGMPGKPAIAEHLAIQRGIELAQYTNSCIHFTGVSTKGGIELIKQAKKKKVNMSCSVNLHHLLLTDEKLITYDSCYKINPPLRSKEDKIALVKALEDGVIDAIASHHLPQNWDAKQQEFEYAKEGMIALQIMLPLLLKVSCKLSIADWITLLTDHPRKILHQPLPLLEEKVKACLTVFSTSKKWSLNEESNLSKSSNSPYFGEELVGQVLAVVNNEQTFIHG
jgi:dihydroorotase